MIHLFLFWYVKNDVTLIEQIFIIEAKLLIILNIFINFYESTISAFCITKPQSVTFFIFNFFFLFFAR